jgi:dinuclear metal center YbgI/SA1388 family protein
MSRPLSQVISSLEQIAPLELAAAWDNVGLLIEPTAKETQRVDKGLLTIDLTERVLAEAFEERVQLIVAYHPPIFSGLQRLTRQTAIERVIVEAIDFGVFVYCPHTALDACQGGLNDWLSSAFGSGKSAPIEPHQASTVEGQGRLLKLDEPLRLERAIARVKAHLKLQHIRVARSAADSNPSIASVAVCAGAGGSVLSMVHADLYLTGEMRHHDILVKQSEGSSVIVCDHTNTERGYLPSFRAKLDQLLNGDVEFILSKCDREPLELA